VDSGPAYGAEQRVSQPFRSPNTPTLTQPANGAADVVARPLIQGSAEPNTRVHLFLDGVLLAMVTSSSTGAYAYSVPVDLAPGAHVLTASAEVLGARSPLSAPTRFDVVGVAGDGGTPDGGTPDPEPPDAGTPDAGTPDAGTTVDGGPQVPGAPAQPPIVVIPAEGEVVDSTPLLGGTARGAYKVGLEVDGEEVTRVTVDAEGRFRYELTEAQALAPGAHRVIARTYEPSGGAVASSAAHSFEVATAAEVGCGCGASSGAGLGAVALLLAAWASRRRPAH
jgi:uncharacterized protein (TIGR03382 family)